MIKTLFLPGAGGSARFWLPVAERLAVEGVFLSWPGLVRSRRSRALPA